MNNWRYDGTGSDFYREPLVGEYLEDGEYRRFELNRESGGMTWGHSPTLDLDLCLGQRPAPLLRPPGPKLPAKSLFEEHAA